MKKASYRQIPTEEHFLFAPWQPEAVGKQDLTGVQLRCGRDSDLDSIVALQAERHQLDPKKLRQQLAGRFVAEEYTVAAKDDELLAFGRRMLFTPPSHAHDNCVPPGWYLMGLCVAPAHRRQGLGRQITDARLSALQTTTQQVYYFVNSLNQASIALHQKLGFKEIATDIWFPGVSFSAGGQGVLYARFFKSKKA